MLLLVQFFSILLEENYEPDKLTRAYHHGYDGAVEAQADRHFALQCVLDADRATQDDQQESAIEEGQNPVEERFIKLPAGESLDLFAADGAECKYDE